MQQQQQLSTKELETQILESLQKNPVSFEQKADDLAFDMPSISGIKTAFSKPIITMAIGSASSGLLAGVVASAIPVNLQFFAGMPTIVTGLLGRMFLKSETAKNFFDGVLIAGISQAVSRFIPATLPFGQKFQEEFKQEKPCDKTVIRDGVRW